VVAAAAPCEPFRFTKVRAIDLDVVFDLAWLDQPRVELLTMVPVMVAPVRLQQVASEDQNP
jgi:hypothetical protein